MNRRKFIAAAGLVAAGGTVAGGALANVAASKEAAPGSPPPLPWAWGIIDPVEAGQRAFRTYHEKGG